MGKQSKRRNQPTISKKHIRKHGSDLKDIPIDKFMIEYEDSKQRNEISMDKLTYSQPVGLGKGEKKFPAVLFEFN